MVGAIVSCVHIPVSKKFEKRIKKYRKYITDDSLVGGYNFDTLKEYTKFPLFPYIHRSSASKNYALYKAYKAKEDIVYIIDSDCIIPRDFEKKHLKALSQKGGLYDNPLHNTGFYPRGYPYFARDKEIVANVGLWTNVLDINGKDRGGDPSKPDMRGNLISNSFIPFSGMNVAVKREAIPALFFMPNIGKFRRHDDIFGGYIFQSIVKKRGDIMSYGEPFVYHDTKIVPKEDEEEEREMNDNHNLFIEIVDEAISKIKVGSYQEMYSDFVDKVKFEDTKFEAFIEPMKIWTKLLS